MKVVLRDANGTSGGTWIDDAPDGDWLALTEVTVYEATGETLRDATWGAVRVYREMSYQSHLTGAQSSKGNEA